MKMIELRMTPSEAKALLPVCHCRLEHPFQRSQSRGPIMTSEQLAARMVAQMNADPQFGTSAAERIRTDAKLAWLQSQRTSLDVDSLYALVSYGSSPETQRQQRIKAMIIARTWQLRGMTAAFYENLFRARDLRANSKAMNAAADAVDAMEAAHGIVSRPVDEAVLVGAVARALEVA